MSKELTTAFFVIVTLSVMAYPFVRMINFASNFMQQI
jgi:hypothetical protein